MKKVGICGAGLALLFFLTGPLSAQAQTGEIRLEVKDPSGAGVEASGTIENSSAGIRRNFQTDAQGRYASGPLPMAVYRVEVERAGFASQILSIEVRSQTPVVETITLALKAVESSVQVETTPLPGGDVLIELIPSPVQVANQLDIEQSGALDLSDFLNRRLSGVHVNEVQGNPFQPDINYRGYTASPLLGTPQGLSLYLDGVRLNQPFGDVVSWDLIPRIAISETTLMPGSNPMFGLNTLGGALSVQTKDGSGTRNTAVQVAGGSFRRGTIDAEQSGASKRGLNWYLASSLFFENGWRDASPSDVRQFFGKFGWQRPNTGIKLSFTYANNSLNGNGVQEQRFIARDYASVYTKPDNTANRSPFLNFSAQHSFSSTLKVSGNAYYRYIRTNTINGDLNGNSLDQQVYQPSAADISALTAAGYKGFPTSGANAADTPFPFWRCIAQGLQRDEPAEKCNGMINHSHANQHNYGASGQMTWFGSSGSRHNQFTAGAGWDGNRVNFLQSSELGYLNPDRSITGVHAFGDGVSGGTINGVPFDTRVDLNGRIHTGSAYATDTLSLGNAWNFTISGRYNRTVIGNADNITPGGGPGSLDSHNVFGRFNPAIGVTFSPTETVNAYGSYSEGSRAPTSIELGCADPAQPCKLPNAMAGDPPLSQVVTRTFEAGVRSRQERPLSWDAGWFRTQNHNDILFVASNQTGFGYFKNFGRTRREGFQFDLSGRTKRITIGGGYTYLAATYQTTETVDGSSNSTNDSAAAGVPGLDGTVTIQPGDRIPLIPQHTLKAFADIQLIAKVSVDLDLVTASSSYARGNENNLHQADGGYYLGPGTSPGYGVLNLGARYQINPRLKLFGQINNVFDHRYYTAAQLGPTGFTDGGNFIARPFPAAGADFPLQHATFYAPGSPRLASIGLRVTF